jgi:CheY-like chemotaxis protein
MAPSAVRTMIVDDHADVRFLIRTIVQEAGPPLQIVGEADGVEAALEALDALAPDVVVLDARMPRIDGFEAALEALDALAPDVVVLDARMPRIDGFEAAPMLRERRPGLPIVLCSAWVDDEVRRRAHDAGISAVLSKDQFDEIPGVVLELAGVR